MAALAPDALTGPFPVRVKKNAAKRLIREAAAYLAFWMEAVR